MVFLGKYGFGVLCMLRRYVAFLGYFVWYMCGAGSVGWCFVFRRPSEYKAPGCERWGEESVVLRGLPAASVLAFCLLVCYVWPG